MTYFSWHMERGAGHNLHDIEGSIPADDWKH